jgi:hypothetical protein
LISKKSNPKEKSELSSSIGKVIASCHIKVNKAAKISERVLEIKIEDPKKTFFKKSFFF